MKMSARNSAIAGFVAGLGYIVQAIIGLIKPQTEVFSGSSDYVLEAVFIIALLSTVVALLGLHSLKGALYGRAGMVGLWLAVIGTALLALSAVVTLFAGRNSLGPAFLGGTLLALIGYIVLGVSVLRARALPLWGGLALMLGFPLSLVLSAFGGILFGLAWLSVGYLLLKKEMQRSRSFRATPRIPHRLPTRPCAALTPPPRP